jgi:apolipoprotein N-acyltransferase
MKTSLVTTLATLFLAALVWIFFNRTTPDAPLSGKEMVFVVIVCLVLVLFIQFLWRLLRKERTK